MDESIVIGERRISNDTANARKKPKTIELYEMDQALLRIARKKRAKTIPRVRADPIWLSQLQTSNVHMT